MHDTILSKVQRNLCVILTDSPWFSYSFHSMSLYSLSLCMCIHVCICVCVHACVRACVCVCVCCECLVGVTFENRVSTKGAYPKLGNIREQ